MNQITGLANLYCGMQLLQNYFWVCCYNCLKLERSRSYIIHEAGHLLTLKGSDIVLKPVTQALADSTCCPHCLSPSQ